MNLSVLLKPTTMSGNYQYPGEELQLFEEARHWKRYLADKIRPYIRGSVLEVGAGMSETTPYLVNEHVSRWVCLEPDTQLLTRIKEKAARGDLPRTCTPRQGTLDYLSESEYFDTIIYIDVLEHIENDGKEMLKATSHLNEGGHLIVLSPAFQYLYSPFDKAVGHYRRYNKQSLRVVAPPTLVEKRMFYLESAGVFLLLLNRFIFKKVYPTKATIRFWDRMLIPVSRLADRLFRYSFGKTIIGIWQKK
jgi:hypothetical protein